MNILKNFVFLVIAISVIGAIIWRYPVNGWGSLVWLAGVIALSLIRRPYEKANKENEVTDSRKTTLEKSLLSLVFIGSSLLPVLHLCFGLVGFVDYYLPFQATGGGVLLLISGLWLFWRSHADLGRNWSVTLEIRKDHKLVTSGVYQTIRHPMYSAILLISAAQVFLIHNWIAGFSSLVAFALLCLFRIPHEEAMMREQFGEEYNAYSRNSGRIFPKLF